MSTPIRLCTPLEIMTDSGYTKTHLADCSAIYDGRTHDVLANIATILQDTDTQSQLDASFRQALYHELFHAGATPWASEVPHGVQRSEYFPVFIEEAMAEKISFRLLEPDQQEVIRRLVRSGSLRSNYPQYRHAFIRPRHTMEGVYSGYRYALDMVMATLDWAAAEIDQLEAIYTTSLNTKVGSGAS